MPLTGQAKTDYQRDYMRRYQRQRRRRAKVAAERVPKPRSAAEPGTGLPDCSLLTEVTTQRDELRQQLDRLRRDLAALQDICFGCGRREDQVDVFRISRGLIAVCLCEACIDGLGGKLQDIRRAQPAMDNR
jgi:hypothetical protein